MYLQNMFLCGRFISIFVGTCSVLHVGIRRVATRQHGVTSRVICDDATASGACAAATSSFFSLLPPTRLLDLRRYQLLFPPNV